MTLKRVTPNSTSYPSGIGEATYAGLVATEIGEISKRIICELGGVGGTATAITASVVGADALTALVSPMTFWLTPASDVNAAATLAIDGLPAVAIRDAGGTVLGQGGMKAGRRYLLSYDGTNLRIVGGGGDVSGIAPSVAGNIPVYTDTGGKEVEDSGVAVSTDGTFAANSDAKLPTEKAVKTYVDALLGVQDAMIFKGVIDCSANPNYPAADRGHTYRVSVAGKIGGGSGPNVEVGDLLICITDSTASGDHATVGANWAIIQTNLDGAVIGPASVTDSHFAQFDGASGKLLKGGIAPSSLPTLAADNTFTGQNTFNIGTITASKPFTISQTWNNGAVAFSALLVDVTDTASAAGSFLTRLAVGGADKFYVTKAGAAYAAGPIIGDSYLQAASHLYGVSNTSAIYFGVASDTILTRDAANIWAQRNGANAQAFRIYNTYTDASNYERLAVEWNSNTAYLRTQAAGTGSARNLALDGQDLFFQTGGISRWQVAWNGHLFAITDNVYDIGATATNRPRNLFLGSALVVGGDGQAQNFIAINYFYWPSATRMFGSTDGNLRLTNFAATDFGLLQFGGTTSAYPALKRSGTELHVRFADDTAYAIIQTKIRLETDAVPSTATDAGSVGDVRYDASNLYVCVATNTWKRAALATW